MYVLLPPNNSTLGLRGEQCWSKRSQCGYSSRVGHCGGGLAPSETWSASDGLPCSYQQWLALPVQTLLRIWATTAPHGQGFSSVMATLTPVWSCNARQMVLEHSLGSGCRMCQSVHWNQSASHMVFDLPFPPCFVGFVYFCFGCIVWLVGLSFRTKDWTQTSAVKTDSPNHWTTKEFPHSAMEASKLSASPQLVFNENCSPYRWIFYVFVGGGEFHVLLFCHLDSYASNSLIIYILFYVFWL